MRMLKKRRCLPPFSDYYSYGPSSALGGDRLVISLSPESGSDEKPRMMTYARYLYMVKSGVLLSSSIQVDHIDGDRTNDTFENLQSLTARENSVKSVLERKCAGTQAEMICPQCKGLFYRDKRQTHLAKKGEFTACGRKCAGRFRKRLQDAREAGDLLLLEKLKTRMSSNFVQWVKNQNPRGRILVEHKRVAEPWETVSVVVPEAVREHLATNLGGC